MEYKKNRQRVVLESLTAQKTPDWGGLAPPAFLLNAKPAQIIAERRKQITEQQAKLKGRIKSILDNPSVSDPVYKVLQRIFKAASPYNLTRENKIRFTIRNLARKRFVLGYPPRKKDDTSIGDAVNWEWLVSCATPSGKHVIIVSRDADYGISYQGRSFLNDWLRQEFKERVSKKRQLVLTDRLAEAFKLVSVKVNSAAIKEEEELRAEAVLRLPSMQLDATSTAQPGVPGDAPQATRP